MVDGVRMACFRASAAAFTRKRGRNMDAGSTYRGKIAVGGKVLLQDLGREGIQVPVAHAFGKSIGRLLQRYARRFRQTSSKHHTKKLARSMTLNERWLDLMSGVSGPSQVREAPR